MHDQANAQNELGIENLWEWLKVVGTGYNGVSSAMADGKFTLPEIIAVMTSLGFELPAAIQDGSQALPEAKDLNNTETDELQRRLVAHFQAPDHVEQRAMAGIDAVQVLASQVLPLLKFAFAGGDQPENWIPPERTS